MKFNALLYVGSLVTAAYASSDICANAHGAASTCELLKKTHPHITLLSSDADYINETRVSWTTAAWLKPACVYLPRNAEDVSHAVKAFKRTGTLFAFRGGGHTPIANSANIGSYGVLISSTNLNTLKFSHDKSILHVGPGPRWGDVFTYMNNTGLAIVGGRLGAVGIPGLLLGGGMSYYSYERGLASTGKNIAGYEVVLADGKIVEANAHNRYSYLYWALQGGGNSFGLVTRFDLKTFPVNKTYFADASYGEGAEIKEKWLETVLEFAQHGDQDTKAAIIPVVRYGGQSSKLSYDTTLFYGGVSASPKVFRNFLGGRLTPISHQTTLKSPLAPKNKGTTLNTFPLANYGALIRPAFEKGGQSYGLRQKFHVQPVYATKEAMEIVHDTLFDAAKKEGLSKLDGFFLGLAFNSITKTLVKVTNKGGGALSGLEEVPSFWIEQSYTWLNDDDDAKIEAFVKSVNKKISEKIEAAGLRYNFYWMNDSDPDQPVFENYPGHNLKKLKQIRAKYDPSKVYTNLMPGGFKVDRA